MEAQRHDRRFAGEGAAARAAVSGRRRRLNTLLVTGGAGFIGSNFVRHALRHTAARIVVLDKLTYAGNRLNLEDALTDPRVRFVQADIGDRSAVERVFTDARPDAVVNLAAETHVDRSIDSAAPFVETNVTGTFVLLETARRHLASSDERARRAFRFVHVSTDEVYGSLGPTGAFSEDSPYAPNSPYAASKAAADHLVRAWQHTYGLPAIVTNCSNNYGPFQFPEKLIPLVVLNAIDGRPLPIYGDGGQVRDWLHVADHAAALQLVVERGEPGAKYNVGASAERTNLQIVDAICDALGELRPGHDYRALKAFVPDRPGHDRRYAIDAAKIRRELGWAPRVQFESGLKETVRWYLEHRAWCSEVLSGRYDRQRLGLASSTQQPAPSSE